MNARRLLAVFTFMLLAIVAWSLLRQRAATTGVVVAGGDGGGLPRATADEEGFDAGALGQAEALAQSLHAQALLVLRHGHLVLDYRASGTRADALAEGGAMSEAVVALVAGIAAREHGLEPPAGPLDAAPLVAAIAAASGVGYADYLSRSLWQPLNAGPARLQAPDGTASPGCCLAARPADWLRVAALLMAGGRFEGTQVIGPEWLARMGTPLADDPGRGWGLWLAPAARGAEPFAVARVVFLRGPGSTRLWMMPTLDLAVLLVDDVQPGPQPGAATPGAAATSFDETRVPNLVVRALRAQQPASGQGLGELVTGH